MRKGESLFPRVEEENKSEEKKMMETENVISYEDFQKIDLRVAKVLAAENIKKSDRLLKLRIDVGEERTVVAGLVGHYTEEDLEGKQVVVVANLEPAKLMGVESQGMVLAATDESGVHLLSPDASVTPGSEVT